MKLNNITEIQGFILNHLGIKTIRVKLTGSMKGYYSIRIKDYPIDKFTPEIIGQLKDVLPSTKGHQNFYNDSYIDVYINNLNTEEYQLIPVWNLKSGDVLQMKRKKPQTVVSIETDKEDSRICNITTNKETFKASKYSYAYVVRNETVNQ